MLKWGERIKPLEQLAFNGEGQYATGEYCRFCRARANHYLSLEEFHKMKPLHLLKLKSL
jgi:hypothetical protein